MSLFGLTVPVLEEAPPVRVCRERWAGVSLKAVIELVRDEMNEEEKERKSEPIAE